MKASEMTNEKLAKELDNILVNDELQSFAEVDRQTEALREAAARLRKADADVAFANACADETDDDCDAALIASEAEVADLRRRLKVAENALKKCAKVQCDGYDDSITCEECDLACDGRCAQWMAKKALAAIRRDGGAK